MPDDKKPGLKRAGLTVHFVRPQESGCRSGKLIEDSFQETMRVPPVGIQEFGHFSYGDAAGGPRLPHTFEAVRRYDPLGTVDTWHLAAECPFVK